MNDINIGSNIMNIENFLMHHKQEINSFMLIIAYHSMRESSTYSCMFTV